MELDFIDVAAAKKKQFESRGIRSVEDLLQFLPRKYKDYSKITGILPGDQVSCFYANVQQVRIEQGSKVTFITAVCTEPNTNVRIYVRWFNMRWAYNRLKLFERQTVVIAGKVEYSEQYHTYSVNNPEVFDFVKQGLGIYPVYKSVPGMSYDYLTKKMAEAIRVGILDSENLPVDIVQDANQITMPVALRYIHKPTTMEEVEKGQNRILFNDLIYFAVQNELNATNISAGSQYNVKSRELVNSIISELPFSLTADQHKAVFDMIELAENGRRINALLQADVGAGKTEVVLLVAAAMVDSGYQVAIMAPTQVLAKQHFESFTEQLATHGVKIGFLYSGMKKKERAAELERIASGETQVVIGTHSCIADDVVYHDLALTVVDEEHKFGVQQRGKIIEKGARGVHNVTMSATPIPRSLAQVVYGDSIQLFTINTMPEGRKPVITGINRNQDKLFRFLISQIKEGHQAYVVCPLIEASEKIPGLLSVDEVSAIYRKTLEPHGIRIETLTGRDSKERTEQVISDFKAGNTDILISTTVIEVGVNVPNATVMVISNAERFGLSGLHQLRGRVGRGKAQSYCALRSDASDEKAMARLNAMCSTTSGFEIAEADLKLRGAGDFLGTQQSGENKYVSLMIANPDMYQKCKGYAKELIQRGFKCCKMMQQIKSERDENVD